MNAITLFELNGLIKQTLKGRFTDALWITAEIASVQENRSGHCYVELADKQGTDDQVVAVAKGTIWAFTYRMLKPYFETTTGRGLEKGMKVLVQVEVVFHELYGFSLNIKDIDPTFTVGDLERKKREIIGQLEKDGIIDMNRNLELAMLPKNIAVISSPTAAGLGDFISQLQMNPSGYKFHVKLFPAVMQGDKTTESVVAALDRIYEYENLFDVVVIIRGGGSQTDLGSFDSYEMAANIAQFPLPVIAGIGHERDETIADRVAYLKVKTPTAAAAFLIETFQRCDSRLQELKADVVTGIRELLKEQKTKQLANTSAFKHLTQVLLNNQDSRLRLLSRNIGHDSKLFIQHRMSGFEGIRSRLSGRLALLFDRQKNMQNAYRENVRHKSAGLFAKERHILELAETKIKHADPENILKQGYSLTLLNGKAVKSVRDVKTGDLLETLVAGGKVASIVTKLTMNDIE